MANANATDTATATATAPRRTTTTQPAFRRPEAAGRTCTPAPRGGPASKGHTPVGGTKGNLRRSAGFETVRAYASGRHRPLHVPTAHHPPGTGQRTCPDQCRRPGGAQAQNLLARRHHASGDVAATVRVPSGSARAKARAAPDSLWCPQNFAARSERTPASRAWCAGALIYNLGRAARAGGDARNPARGAARARAARPGIKARQMHGDLRASPL